MRNEVPSTGLGTGPSTGLGTGPSTGPGAGRIVFNLALIGVAAFAILMARQWSFKAAFFPLVTGIPLLVLATVQLVVDLFARPSASGESRLDLDFAADVPPEVARRRTVAIFAWILGFILLVFLLGFPVAIPVFVFAYLAPQAGVRWWLKVFLAVVAWGCFHALFERLLHLPFEAGRIQVWLGLG